jgi:hypothetical protein
MWKNGQRPLAYLAGAIENAPEGGKVWRREISEFLVRELNHMVFDPTREENHVLTEEEFRHFRQWKTQDLQRFKQVVHKIIQKDIGTLLEQVDYIVCYWDEHVLQGGGTHGELTMAYWHSIPVYLWIGMPLEQISSWIIGCSTQIFKDKSSLKKFLRQKYGS